MVRTLTWVLVGVLVYTLVAMGLRSRGLLPDSIKVSGPITTLHTKRGRDLLDRLAQPRRFWRAYANVGIGIALVVMVLSFLMILLSGLLAFQQEPTAINQPRNALVIPGVNQFIPLSVTPYVVLGLVIALVIHEGGHGLLCRVEDIDIESMGLAFVTIIPMGAFVEPDEESREAADRGAQTRMFVAGVTNNFVIGAVAIALLFGPVAGSIAVVDGYPVGGSLDGSPASAVGIGSGDVITHVEGTPVTTDQEWQSALAAADGERVRVTVQNGGETRDVSVSREVVVTGAPEGWPIGVQETITAVNGTAVYSEQGLREAVADRPVARLTAANGSETHDVTLPMGALVQVAEGGPLAAAGAPAGEGVVVTSFGGERVVAGSDLTAAIEAASPGETVTVVAYSGGDPQPYTVTLGEQGPDDAFLGVRFGQAGVTGMTFDDFGTTAYQAGFYLESVGGDADAWGGTAGGLLATLAAFLFLPFAGLVPGIGTGFPGFVGVATNFFVVEGPLAVLGTGGVFALANALFWTAWINVIVGQFNLIPAFPLDGGHVLRTSAEAVVARLPVARKRALTKVVTVSIGLLMLGSILLALFGPQLTS